EPRFSLRLQSIVWMAGFVVFACVCAGIGYSIHNASRAPEARPEGNTSSSQSWPAGGDRILWVLLAACGSLLLSAVTNYLSQNVAAIPLLWIIPLVMYLLSFVVAFNGERFCPRWLTWILFPLGLGASEYLLHGTELQVSFKLSII